MTKIPLHEQFAVYSDVMTSGCFAIGSAEVLDALIAEFQPDVVMLDMGWMCWPGLAAYFEHYKVRVLPVWTLLPMQPLGELFFSVPSYKAYWPMGGLRDMNSLLDRTVNVLVDTIMTVAFGKLSIGAQVILDSYVGLPGPAGSAPMGQLNLFDVTRRPRLHVATWLPALYPGPMNPAFHNVGPLLVKDPKPLPEEGGLKDFFDSAPSSGGVIVVSLGSTSFLPIELVTVMTHGLLLVDSAKYRVLWRTNKNELAMVQAVLEAAGMEGPPAHLKVVDWFPQLDALCHENTVLFVTHVGANGMQEGIHAGWPTLYVVQQSGR